MNIPGPIVNCCSRALLVTIALFVLAVGSWPRLAQADSVLVYPVEGRAEQDRLEEVGQTIRSILEEQGHRATAPVSGDDTHPIDRESMETAASSAETNYVLTAEVEPLRGQYRLHIHVYYRAAGRLEELVVTVMTAEERTRLSDVLSSMVRAEGLGDDAVRLTSDGEPAQTPPEETEETDPDATDSEENGENVEEDLEEERQRAEEAERERREQEQAAWDSRPQYGTDGEWMVQARVGGMYALALGDLVANANSGGGMIDLGLAVGRTFDGLTGFEIRAGADVTTATLTGLRVYAGAAWLGSFFVEPIYIGVGGDVGAIFSFTGAREVGFSGRIYALFAWRPLEHLYFEAAIPEIGIISPGVGALTFGASVRAGYRF